MTDTHDKELVVGEVAKMMFCAYGYKPGDEQIWEGATSNAKQPLYSAAEKFLAEAKPHLEKQVRAEVLRDMLSDWSVRSDIGRAISTYLKAYAAKYNIDLTTEEKG